MELHEAISQDLHLQNTSSFNLLGECLTLMLCLFPLPRNNLVFIAKLKNVCFGHLLIFTMETISETTLYSELTLILKYGHTKTEIRLCFEQVIQSHFPKIK